MNKSNTVDQGLTIDPHEILLKDLHAKRNKLGIMLHLKRLSPQRQFEEVREPILKAMRKYIGRLKRARFGSGELPDRTYALCLYAANLHEKRPSTQINSFGNFITDCLREVTKVSKQIKRHITLIDQSGHKLIALIYQYGRNLPSYRPDETLLHLAASQHLILVQEILLFLKFYLELVELIDSAEIRARSL